MKPRYYQIEAVQATLDYFLKGGKGSPLLVLPTGTGKAGLLGFIIKAMLSHWPKLRFVQAVHTKELVKNNADTIQRINPGVSVGICSAGLRRKDFDDQVICGGIGTIRKRAQELGYRDMLLIDEAHLVSDKEAGVYLAFIDALRGINPNLVVVGLTATPYRLGMGMLTDGAMFTDVVYDISKLHDFNRLIEEQYLAPLYPKRTKTELDISDVSTKGGELNQAQLQAAVDQNDVTYRALCETVEHGQYCRSWLAFASGVEHAEHVAEMLRSFGVPTEAIHAKVPGKERDARIDDFKAGRLRCLVNNNVLTTGFDHPPIDLIVMLRPTMSPSLWVQMLGRGTRPSPDTGKKGCMVLDFAGNTRRLGPINDPVLPRKKGKGTGDAPVRICEACGTYNHASARVCIMCGEEFPRSQKLFGEAGTDELIRVEEQVIETFPIERVIYTKHVKRSGNGPPTLRADYYSGLQSFSEWVCFEHEGSAKGLAKHWWKQRVDASWSDFPPPSVDQALTVTGQLRSPKSMRVDVGKKHPEILSFEW